MKCDQDLCLNSWYDPKSYFGKQNSTLGSVVPLAMFYCDMTKEWWGQLSEFELDRVHVLLIVSENARRDQFSTKHELLRCEIPWRNTYFSARSVPSRFHKSEIWYSYSWACCIRRDIFLRRALYLTMFHNSPGCANNSSSPLANCKMSHNVRNVESRMEMMQSLVNTHIKCRRCLKEVEWRFPRQI